MKKLFLKLEHLVGLHPDDPNYANVKAEIARIAKDTLTPAESKQLDATIAAIEKGRHVVPVPPVPNPQPVPQPSNSPPSSTPPPLPPRMPPGKT